MQEQTRLRHEAGAVDRGRTSFAVKGLTGQLKLNRRAGETSLCVSVNPLTLKLHRVTGVL